MEISKSANCCNAKFVYHLSTFVVLLVSIQINSRMVHTLCDTHDSEDFVSTGNSTRQDKSIKQCFNVVTGLILHSPESACCTSAILMIWRPLE